MRTLSRGTDVAVAVVVSVVEKAFWRSARDWWRMEPQVKMVRGREAWEVRWSESVGGDGYQGWFRARGGQVIGSGSHNAGCGVGKTER